MNSKAFDLRLIIFVFASLLVTCASALYSSTDYLAAHEMGASNADRSDSDYRRIVVWGAPLPFVYDMLNSQSIGQIDRRDYFSGGAFLGDWLFWFAVAWPLSYVLPIFCRFFFRFVREVAHPTQEK